VSRTAGDPELQKLLEKLEIDDHLYWPYRFSKITPTKLVRQITTVNANWKIKIRTIISKTGLHIVRVE